MHNILLICETNLVDNFLVLCQQNSNYYFLHTHARTHIYSSKEMHYLKLLGKTHLNARKNRQIENIYTNMYMCKLPILNFERLLCRHHYKFCSRHVRHCKSASPAQHVK
jgi:hypothetical protein